MVCCKGLFVTLAGWMIQTEKKKTVLPKSLRVSIHKTLRKTSRIKLISSFCFVFCNELTASYENSACVHELYVTLVSMMNVQTNKYLFSSLSLWLSRSFPHLDYSVEQTST